MNVEQDQPNFSALDVARFRQLDHVCKRYNYGSSRMSATGGHRFTSCFVDVDGEIAYVDINPNFLFGLWDVREKLVKRLSDTGHKEGANELVDIYERRRQK